MSSQLFRGTAAATLCLLIPVVGASAQQARYSQRAALPQAAYATPYAVQSPAANLVLGTYHSDAFFPSTLTLTITAMDQYGKLHGSMNGWRSSWAGGETGDTWARWHRTFGHDAEALYRNGKIHIMFPNNVGYVFDVQDGYRLNGHFVAENERSPVVFQKVYSAAAAR